LLTSMIGLQFRRVVGLLAVFAAALVAVLVASVAAPVSRAYAYDPVSTSTTSPANVASVAALSTEAADGSAETISAAAGFLVATEDGETFYRTMSEEHFAQLGETGRVPASSETFISPSGEYASGYNGVTVRFSVKAGTTDALAGIGVRDSSALTSAAYPDMPLVSSGWADSSAFFKGEGGNINIGLGRGPALDIFNNGILGWGAVP
jgi:hypothetical protein